MPKRLFCILLAAFILTAPLAGCSRKKGINLSYPVLADVRTFDPQYTASATAKTVITNCFDCLVARDREGTIIPAAAESWEKDGRTYTFHLRANARWRVSSTVRSQFEDKLPQDYAPQVTAADFVFAFRRLASPQTASPSAYIYDAIQNFSEARAGKAAVEQIGVVAVSDFTLTVTTAYDDPDFLAKLAMPAAAPCCEAFFTLCGGRYGLGTEYLLSNGPYYLSRWEDGSYFRITQDEDYTGKRKAQSNTVWFYLNDDAQNMNTKLANGVYSAGVTNVTAFDPGDVNRDYAVSEIEDVLCALIFNCRSGVAATGALRQALIYSADREIFSAEPVGYLPKNAAASLPDGVAQNGVPAEALTTAKASLKEALTELGTEKTEITILCAQTNGDMLKRQMQHWQKTLGVSVNIKISAVPDNELLQAVAAGDYEAAYYPLRAESDSYIDYLSSFVTNAPNNVTRYASEVYDAQFNALCAARTPADTAGAADQLLGLLKADGVLLPASFGATYCLRGANAANMYFCGSIAQMYFTQ